MNIRLRQALGREKQHGTLKEHRTFTDVENWDGAGVQDAFLEGNESSEAGKTSRGLGMKRFV